MQGVYIATFQMVLREVLIKDHAVQTHKFTLTKVQEVGRKKTTTKATKRLEEQPGKAIKAH